MQNTNSIISTGTARVDSTTCSGLGSAGLPATTVEAGVTSGLLPYLIALGNPLYSDARKLLVATLAQHMIDQANEPARKKMVQQRLRAEAAEAELRKHAQQLRKRPAPSGFDR